MPQSAAGGRTGAQAQRAEAVAEKGLEEIAAATQRKRRPVRSPERISYLVGRRLGSSKMEKYYHWEITPQGLRWERNGERIERDAALDGIYVLRTSVDRRHLDCTQTVLAYKRLAVVERAFRSLKSVDLNVRPIYHGLPDGCAPTLPGHVAYYVEWMRQLSAPVLFDDEQRNGRAFSGRSGRALPGGTS